jgi:hypothetical protein
VSILVFYLESYYFSALWRQENILQQEINTTREELSKKEQGLRSMTGKVGYSLIIQ